MTFFFISPTGYRSPDLFDSFVSTFRKEGHLVTSDINAADIVGFDFHTRIGDYDLNVLRTVIEKKLPVFTFNEWDYGSMNTTDIPPFPLTPEQGQFLFSLERNGNKTIHFVRKLNRLERYPDNYYPYEKVIMNEFPLTTSQELNSRPYEIVFCGNHSPSRKKVIDGLTKAGFKVAVHWTNENGKIPHKDWIELHTQGKLFLSADGGGFSDERPYQLFTVAPMLRQKNNHLQVFPFSEYTNCLAVSETPTDEEISGIKSVLSDFDYLYEIYLESVDFMREHYSESARAKYILSILKQENIL